MTRIEVEALPAGPLAAAAEFHRTVLPRAVAALAGGAEALVLVFAPAGHDHAGWRLAAVQGLAREHAPCRVNAVVSDDEAAIAATLGWLEIAPGVTGQLLVLAGTSD